MSDVRERTAPASGPTMRQRIARTRWRRALRASRPLDFAYRVVVAVVGTALVAFGLLTVPLPGPGWLTVIAGLGVLATEFTWAERLLTWTRQRVSAWTTWVGQRPVWLRVLLVLATAAFVVAVVVVLLHLLGVPSWVPAWVPLWR